jgi:DNA polymerase delta subunit 1
VKDPVTGTPLEGREAIVATQRLTEEAGKMVTTCLKAPHDFEYDKVFSPFIIFSKKRYVGNKYEESPDEYYQNSMGIATKRRDYAGIVKVIYGGAIRILLTDRDPVAAAAFVKTKLMDLASGRVSLNQLMMTKSLRAEYATPTPPAHKVLANRIAARDPGNAPASGDRVSFLYVMPSVGQQASKLQGDRVDTGLRKGKGVEGGCEVLYGAPADESHFPALCAHR